MIGSLAVLLAFQLVGEVAVQLSGVPVPGPVVGMVLLFIALRWRESLPDALRTTAETLLSHLSLLFIPAGVGIIQHGARLADEWLALLAAMVLSTLITVAVTALVMQWVICLQRGVRRNG
jgi:holin-like protein